MRFLIKGKKGHFKSYIVFHIIVLIQEFLSNINLIETMNWCIQTHFCSLQLLTLFGRKTKVPSYVATGKFHIDIN